MAPSFLAGCAAGLALFSLLAHTAPIREGTSTPRRDDNGRQWVDTWTAMPQLTEYANLPAAPFNRSGAVFVNSTIRQTLRMSIPAATIRIRLSNAFGNVSLPITAMTVAYPANSTRDGTLAGASEIDARSLQTVTFSGNSSVDVADGSLAVSDPLHFAVRAQSEISVTVYLEQGQLSNYITSHPGSRVDTYYQFGDATRSSAIEPAPNGTSQHWFFLSAVEAWAPQDARGFFVVGDSITDGRESDTDRNDRWPDNLLARMQRDPDTANIAVLNQAAGGNRVLADGNGPAAVGRIDRDVLAQSGIRAGYAMIFEGVNDIGVAAPDRASQQAIGDQLIQAYEQIITRVHAFAVPMFAATITPFGNNTAYGNAQREVTRQRVNHFIRTSGKFEEVLDFDKVVGNPQNVSLLAPKYDSGDGLHPNEDGYMAIANSIDLKIFQRWADGVSEFQ